MKKLAKRSLAMLLALAMCFSLIHITAFADELDEAGAGAETGSTETTAPADEDANDDVDAGDPNSTVTTWDDTDEDGVNRKGQQTVTDNEDGSTTTVTDETITTPGENEGDSTVEETHDSRTDGITSTDPDRETADGITSSGSETSKGEGSSKTTETTNTPDPDNAEGAVGPTDEEIEDAIEDGTLKNNGKQGEFGDLEDVVDPEDPENHGTDLGDVDMTNEGSFFDDNDLKVNLKPGEENVKSGEVKANKGDYAGAVQKQLDKALEGTTKCDSSKIKEERLDQLLDKLPELAEGNEYEVYDCGDGTFLIVEKQYEGNKLVGFTTRKVTTTVGDAEYDEDGNFANQNGETGSKDPARENGENGEKDNRSYLFDQPEKPKAGTTTNDRGETTTTEVTTIYSEEYYVRNEDGTYRLAEKDEDGNYEDGAEQVVIGFVTESVTVDSQGRVISKSSSSDWGTQTVITPIRTDNSAEWDVRTGYYTKTVTRGVTKDGWTLVFDTETGEAYWTLTATMSDVRDKSELIEENEGWLEVDESLWDDDKFTDVDLDLFYQWTASAKGGFYDFTTGEYLFLGESYLESAVRVRGYNDYGKMVETWRPHLFIIYDKSGAKHYVYCADFQVSPKAGTKYGEEVIDGEKTVGQWSNSEAKNKEIAEHVQAAALNGYWGTKSGTGSLDAVKEMLKEAIRNGKITTISEDDVDLLTPGIAMTATQAAIWSWATSGHGIDINDPFGNYFIAKGDGSLTSSGTANGTYYGEGNRYFTAKDEAVAMALYTYLRSLTQASYQNDEKIDIVGSTITVKSLAEDTSDALTQPVNENDNVYDTEISFVLSTKPSKINDDLVVDIVDPATGRVLATYRLSGSAKAGERYGDNVVVSEDGKTFTLKNVKLAEGVTITLNLRGTQLANKSAYLITAQDASGKNDSSLSQTFVGVKDTKRTVDLEFDLTFTVNEPEVKLTGVETKQEQEATDEFWMEGTMGTEWSTYVDEEIAVTESAYSFEETTYWTRTTTFERNEEEEEGDDDEEEDDDDDEIEVYDGDVPLAEMTEEEIEEEVEIEDEIPLAEMPEEDEELEIEDEIPLAGVPKTGDETAIWSYMAFGSAAAMIGLLAIERKKREEEV